MPQEYRLYLDTETDALLETVGYTSGPQLFYSSQSERWCEYQEALQRLRVTVAVAWRTDEDAPRVYVGPEFEEVEGLPEGVEVGFAGLLASMAGAAQICAWNAGFDLGVLAKYAPGGRRGATAASWARRTFDPMLSLSEVTGRYVGLAVVAEHNLGMGKGADGAQAVRWWQRGQWEPLVEYCRRDVEVLRRVVECEELWVPLRLNEARRALEHTLLREKPRSTRSVGVQTTAEYAPSLEL